MIAGRFLLLVLVAVSRHVLWFIEQPASSKLPLLPPLNAFMNIAGLGNTLVKWSRSWDYKFGLILSFLCVAPCCVYSRLESIISQRWMGLYGHFCPKPSIGLSNTSDTQKSLVFPIQSPGYGSFTFDLQSLVIPSLNSKQ